jgi:hypothetical protein
MTFNFLIHVVAAAVLIIAGSVFLAYGTLVLLMFVDAIKAVFKGRFQ